MWLALAKPQRLIFQEKNGDIMEPLWFYCIWIWACSKTLEQNRGKELYTSTEDEIYSCQSQRITLWLRILFKNYKIMSSNCQEPSLVAKVRLSPWEICNSNDFIWRGETDLWFHLIWTEWNPGTLNNQLSILNECLKFQLLCLFDFLPRIWCENWYHFHVYTKYMKLQQPAFYFNLA